MAGGLLAGVARVDITPGPGIILGGGAFGAAEGTLHPLAAKALALEAGGVRLLLVACDLLGLDAGYAAEVRAAMGAAAGVPADAVMLACTHTHCAPATVSLRAWGRADAGYLADLRPRLVRVAAEAVAAMAPARLAAGQTTCPGVAVNRVVADGPADDTLAVLRITDPAGRPRAVLVNHAAHPVNLHSGTRYTPDFPHYLEARLHRSLGTDVPVLYLSGACGDLNPANFAAEHPSEVHAEETAGRIADAALALWPALVEDPEPALAYAMREADLPLQPLPPRDELLALLDERRAKLACEADRGPTNWTACGHQSMIEWIDEALAVQAAGAEQASIRVPVQALRLGPAVLLGLPGEPFTAIGRAIRRASPFAPTLISTLTNGCAGYFPTVPAFATGSYEAVYCPRYLGLQAFTLDVADVVALEGVAAIAALASRE